MKDNPNGERSIFLCRLYNYARMSDVLLVLLTECLVLFYKELWLGCYAHYSV